ncbi:unnamed protein product [Owenia fusiformis]|nr:unnamed protein product [Owenia fusiformis]
MVSSAQLQRGPDEVRSRDPRFLKCRSMTFLNTKQRDLCLKSRNLLPVISNGAEIGLAECKDQFSTRRWNCTTFPNATNVFGKVLVRKGREKAYIFAISSSGVMFAVTRACAKGVLGICGCDTSIRKKDTEGDFKWGGCSHNIKYGDKFTKEWVDAQEVRLTKDGLMNTWNNEAGRKAIKASTKLICKCHGISGSCSQKICWRSMGNFKEVGSILKEKFDGASQVKFSKKKNRLLPIGKNQKKPTKKDLVYIDDSPDFCEYNPETGSLGTKDRLCNKSSQGLDGCALMCCGRGYHTIVRTVSEECDCTFFWCCRVVCKKCQSRVEEHFCN